MNKIKALIAANVIVYSLAYVAWIIIILDLIAISMVIENISELAGILMAFVIGTVFTLVNSYVLDKIKYELDKNEVNPDETIIIDIAINTDKTKTINFS